MADPLSIVGSVAGITTAGVQASVKLYALAEKIATASQRVASIADDISSTCAILNQVRELIVPQPDAQGTLKSVFNSVALNDISQALRRCRSVFTQIEALLRRAFEQIPERAASHSKIELSRFEKAKWPFLQPQFEDLRNDLREAKGNLVLMIAVASLALAQRDGRQRPVHDRERLELGSTIAQLERTRTIRTHDRNTLEHPPNQKRGLRRLFGKRTSVQSNGYVMSERSRGVTRGNMSGSKNMNSIEACSPSPRQDLDFMSLPSNTTRKTSPDPIGSSIIAPGASINNVAPEGQGIANASSAGIRATELAPASVRVPRIPAVSPEQRDLNLAQDDSAAEQKPSLDDAAPTPFIALSAVEQTPITIPPGSTTTASGTHQSRCHYQGWTTDYLRGLTTGFGNSLSLSRMELPERSLEKLVKTFTDEGHHPHIAMLELNSEQRKIIRQTCPLHLEAELLVVRLQRSNITVSSVFGMLNIDTLQWIVALKAPSSADSNLIVPWADYALRMESPALRMESPESPMESLEETMESLCVESLPIDSELPTSAEQYEPLSFSDASVIPQSGPAATKPMNDGQLDDHRDELYKNISYYPAQISGRCRELRGVVPISSSVQTHHCGGGNYQASTIPENHTHVGGGGYGAPSADSQPRKLKTALFPRFRRQRIMAQPLHHTIERKEEEIVNELLARWTTS